MDKFNFQICSSPIPKCIGRKELLVRLVNSLTKKTGLVKNTPIVNLIKEYVLKNGTETKSSILVSETAQLLLEMRKAILLEHLWTLPDIPSSEGLRTKRQLAPWVQRGVAYARSLPAKR